MISLKKILAILAFNAVCLVFVAGPVFAEERYITDTIIVSLREGPGPQYKPVKTLKTGQSFDVLESRNGFIRVRTKDGDEGWLQDRFTAPRPPATATAKEEKKSETPPAPNELLPSGDDPSSSPQSATAEDSPLKKGSSDQNSPKESSEFKRLQAELDAMTKQFKQLEADSKNVLEAKAENDRLKQEVTTLQKNIFQLEQTNAALEKRQNIYWFVAGGGVFLLGWMVGRISIRRQRHSSSLTL